MKKTSYVNRMLALVCVLVLIFSKIPLAAGAAEDETGETAAAEPDQASVSGNDVPVSEETEPEPEPAVEQKTIHVGISYYKNDAEGLQAPDAFRVHEEEQIVYFNTDIAAELTFGSCEREDLALVSVSQCLNEEVRELYPAGSLPDAPLREEPAEDGTLKYILTVPAAEDGSFRFAITAGEGAMLLVSENNPAGTSSGYIAAAAYTTAWTLVRDTVRPRLTALTITPDEQAVHRELNTEHGNRYYFNAGFSVEAVIEDEHLAAEPGESTISFLRAEDMSDANSEAVRFSAVSAFSGTTGCRFDGEKAVFSDSEAVDGVYAYALFGTDLAGNPLEFGENADRETLLSLTEEGVSGNSLDEANAALISRYVVVDTTAPEGTLTITAEGRDVYVRETGAAAPAYSMPYQLADSAAITLTADGSERTPVKVTLVVEEKNGTKETSAESEGFIFHGSAVKTIEEKMIFRVKEGFIEDLAGNVSEAVSSRRIYLDKEQEADCKDEIAPVINIEPVIKDADYDNQGRPLYKEDAQFKISVIEPYSEADGTDEAERASSGLKSVAWQVQTKDGEELTVPFSGEIYHYEDEVTEGGETFADEERAAFAFDYGGKALTVPANALTNRNDLSLVLIAEDNAGNKRTTTYDFGIDNTAPAVTVAYDNNDVRSGRYFNAARTAAVTVTERNFDSDMITINISAKDFSGNEDSSLYRAGSWSPRNKNGDTANGDADTFVREIEFTGDGEFTVSIGAVCDIAGNEGTVEFDENSKAVNAFVIDTEAPAVSIRTDDESVLAGADGNYCYRADNCGFKVFFEDNGQAAAVPEGSSAVFTAELSGGVTKSWPADRAEEEAALVFAAAEVSSAGDGLHTIRVTAVDAAGNAAEAISDASAGCIFKELEGSFILDTAAPRVTGIETITGNAETDGRLYSDTNSVYYNDSVRVLVTAKDENALAEDYAGSVMKTGAGSDKRVESRAAVSVSGNEIVFSFVMEPDSHFDHLVLTGHDRAGNRLVLADDYVRNTNGNDDLAAAEDGTIVSLHGKTIDTENPTAVIAYLSDDRANMYGNAAYYNRDVKVEILVEDNYSLDGAETGEMPVGVILHYAPDGTEAVLGSTRTLSPVRESEGGRYTFSAALTEEGRYKFALTGADRAGNPIVVTEMKPRTDEAGADVPEAPVTGGQFDAKYEIILDKTAPMFRLSVSSPASVNQGLNKEYGNRYYFSSRYVMTVQVSDANFDADRITVRRGSVTGGLYDSSSARVSRYDVTVPNVKNENTGEGTLIFTDAVSEDGVYRYAVFGSDRAGNALAAPQGALNLDGTDTAAVDAAKEAERGSLETEADTSNHIVIDTVKPVGRISVTNAAGEEYYRMLTNGNVEKAEPYRDERSAKMKLSVDAETERTPVRLDYAVEAQPSSKSQKGTSGTYAYNNVLTIPADGRQQFKVAAFTLTDLAGNSVTAGSGNFIFLDQDDLPSQDCLAPVTAVRAAAPASVRGGGGQDLFDGDVVLSIKITDPYGGQSSSGLADIYYEIYTGGAKIDADTAVLHAKNTEYRANNYTDPTLDYVLEQTVTIPAAGHNYNDIRFVVTAYDNAGNFSKNEYRFGIDTTPPAVRVQFDNNEAENGKYFKADRTAAVTVTERNFDASKVNVATRAAAEISGWKYSAGTSANGDDDTWTCTVSYRMDGEYTLSVSAADLLGRPAGAAEYAGTAPQDFVIDKTAPVLSVSYDNNDAANGKYYRADRTAVLSVADANFEGTNDITVTASEGGSAPGVSFSGTEAAMLFAADGVYAFGGTVTDLAGNVSNRIEEGEFVIDKTMPELAIAGVEDLSANAEPLTITLTMSDANMNEDGISASLAGTSRGRADAGGTVSRYADGVRYVFEVNEDDHYRLTCTAADLAGNTVTKSVSFSENQGGTAFAFLGRTGENRYARERFTPAYILTNVDEVTILSVTLNGREVPYTYTGDRLAFKEELPSDGKYVITVDVTDAAGNRRSDRQEFIVDTKAPGLTVMGLSEDGIYFEEFVVTLRRESPTDEFLEICLDGQALKEGDGRCSAGKNGDICIRITEYAAHELRVRLRDEAGNVTEWPCKFRLTNSILLRWVSDKPLFFASLPVMAGVLFIFLLLLKKRRNEKEKRNH